jgi:hypothetical protein
MRAAIVIALFAAGCYSPSAQSGGYLCDPTASSDDQCPSGLKCVCGTCVVGNGDEACSFRIDFDPSAPSCSDKEAEVCMLENDVANPVTIKVTAFSSPQAPSDPSATPSHYSGTATLTSSWGHPHYKDFHFDNGTATVQISLDRATPPNSTAVIFAKQGDAFGQSNAAIIVDPQPFTVDAAPSVKVGDAPWMAASVGYPTIDHHGGSYTMYFSAVQSFDSKSMPTIGSATSSGDGMPWTVGAAPLVAPGANTYGPSVLRLSDTDLRLFFDQQDPMTNAFSMVQLESTDNGMTFAPPASGAPPLAPAGCPFCDMRTGIVDPWVVQDPLQSSVWRLFFSLSGLAGSRTSSTLGGGRTVDGGATWLVDPLPTPGTGEAAAVEIDVSPHVAYDAYSKLWRMYYAHYRVGPNLVQACATDVNYATSDDGQFWTGTRQSPTGNASLPSAAIHAENVMWGRTINPLEATFHFVGVLPGGFDLPPDPSTPTSLWFSTISRAYVAPQGRQTCDPTEPTCDKCKPADGCVLATCCQAVICLPFAIGRATHN